MEDLRHGIIHPSTTEDYNRLISEMSHIFSTLKKRASPRGSLSKNNSDSEQPPEGARALGLDLYDLTPSESYHTQEIMEEKVKRLEEIKERGRLEG